MNLVEEYSDKLYSDFLFYLEEGALHISPKKGQVIPLILNSSQTILHKSIEEQRSRQGNVRVLVLKARQFGASTYTEGRFFWRTSQEVGKTAMIIAHMDSSTNNLFGMAKLFYERCPKEFRPSKRFSNSKELVFDTDKGDGLKSRYILQTAGTSKAGGRSFTLHYVHASEVAHWADGGAGVLGGSLESIPSEEDAINGTEVILETTANGLDPLFYPRWAEITNKAVAGENGNYKDGVWTHGEWIAIFIPWFFHEGYTVSISSDEEAFIKATLDDHEKWLLTQKSPNGPVTYGQLEWRRRKIPNLVPPLGITKELYFKQEYPSSHEEAFISTGTGLFDAEKLKGLIDTAQPPITRYDLLTGTQWQFSKDGPLSVWEEPKPGKSYIVGADVAEGLEHGDFSTADVVDQITGEQVAHYHGKVHPETFGDILSALGHRYNTAWVVPERNNHGLTTVTRLEKLSYPRLYVETLIEPPKRPRKRWGWVTTSKSKPQIIDELIFEFNEDSHGIKCKETLMEMLDFKKHPDGSLAAEIGKNDDRVMSRAIAGHARRVLPFPNRVNSEKQRNDNVVPIRAGGWRGYV